MESHGLRDTALSELAKTAFYPAAGQKRLTSMIEQKGPIVLCAANELGAPLTIFVNKKTGEPLRDSAVHARIVDTIKAEGADCWFASDCRASLDRIIIQMILKKSLIFSMFGLTQAQPTLLF